MRKMMALEWFTIMCTCLVMGVLWGTWFTLSRTIDQTSPELFIGIGKMSISNLAVPMSILMPLTIISIVVLLFVALKKKMPYSWLVAVALVCMVGVIVSTLAIAVPIDNQIKTWTAQTIPADWTTLRNNWQVAHTIRTFLSIGAVASLVGYVVIKRNRA